MLEIEKLYYPNKGTYKISEFINEGITYHKINPTIKVRLNPKDNCNIWTGMLLTLLHSQRRHYI